MWNTCSLTWLCSTLIVVVMLTGINTETTLEKPEVLNETSLFDDRINVNHNYGFAHAQGKDGSISASQAQSYGLTAGLLYPNGHYTPIASHSGSKGNSFTSGKRPPLTYAHTGTSAGKYGVGGNAGAGYSGGRGSAVTGSHSQQIAIPLGFGGPVLLSNLRPVKHDKHKDLSSSTESIDLSYFSKSPELTDSKNNSGNKSNSENFSFN